MRIPITKYGLTIVGLMALLMLLNWSILADLWDKWAAYDYSGQFGHGPLLPIISAWMIMNRINTFSFDRRHALSLGCISAMFALGAGLFVSRIIEINFLEQLILYISLVLIIWCAYSFKLIKQLAYPLLLLTFALPVWGFLNEALRIITLYSSNLLLSITTIPFYRDGSYFYLPNGTFEVASGCSGLQQFLVSMMLGIVYAHQHYLRFRGLLKVLLYLTGFAILINSIRIFVIILIGYQTEMRSTLVEEHTLLGWVIYGIGIFIFFMLYQRFFYTANSADNLNKTDQKLAGLLHSHHALSVLSAIALFVIAPFIVYQMFVATINNHSIGQTAFKLEKLNYKIITNEANLNWHPDYPQADGIIYEQHLVNDRQVYLYVLTYKHKNENIEPINNLNRFYNKDFWKLVKTDSINVLDKTGKTVKLKTNYIQSGQGKQLLVLGWLNVNGIVTGDLLLAKLYMLRGVLIFKHDIKVVAIATAIEADPESALTLLKQYYEAIIFTQADVH